MLGVFGVVLLSTIKLKLVCLLPSLCVSVVIISYWPSREFSGIVICVCVELFCPVCIFSVFVVIVCPVLVLINVCFSSAVTVLVLGLVSVLTNVSFPPGLTELTKGVVDMLIIFGSGVRSFIASIVSIIRIAITIAVIASVFVLIIFLPVACFIASLISLLEYPDSNSLVRMELMSYPCFNVVCT